MPRSNTATRKTRGKDKAHEAEPFAIRFHNGRWQVKQGVAWRTADQIALCGLPLTIVMPDGSLHGDGVVSRSGKIFRITA